MDRYPTPLLILVSVLIGVTGQLLLKFGMNAVNAAQPAGAKDFAVRAATQWQVPLALMLYAAGAVMWMVVLSRAPLSYAYPFMGLTFVLVTMASALLLSEQVPAARWAGTLMVVAGVLLVART